MLWFREVLYSPSFLCALLLCSTLFSWWCCNALANYPPSYETPAFWSLSLWMHAVVFWSRSAIQVCASSFHPTPQLDRFVLFVVFCATPPMPSNRLSMMARVWLVGEPFLAFLSVFGLCSHLPLCLGRKKMHCSQARCFEWRKDVWFNLVSFISNGKLFRFELL